MTTCEAGKRQNAKSKSQELNRSDPYVSSVTFDDLNDDCIAEVFNWISLKGKIGIQRVSRRWKMIVENIFEMRQDRLKIMMTRGNMSHNFNAVVWRQVDRRRYFKAQYVKKLVRN